MTESRRGDEQEEGGERKEPRRKGVGWGTLEKEGEAEEEPEREGAREVERREREEGGADMGEG